MSLLQPPVQQDPKLHASNTPSPPPSTTTNTITSSTSKLLLFIRSELLPDDPTTHHLHPESPDLDSSTHHHSDASQYAARRREKVITFVSIPKELEKLMGYGFFQCADAFLYVFTFLPLRCLYAMYKYVTCMVTQGQCSLRASDKCELIKILILAISSFLFMYIDTNVLYHVIKSQSVIKLYIFFNMLEVGDRLFGCFSQDTLDALFITATEQVTEEGGSSSSPAHSDDTHYSSNNNRLIRKKKLSTPAHALICGVSILGHALVILLQSTTLSVAINANNRALLTVMMSNNFVELKGSVFKKFDKMNLFQVSCSDIRERFHLFVLLLIVCLQTLREYSWEEARFWVLLPDCLMVLLAEIVVDWLKHAFITRFNELPLQVYSHYTRSLAYDMAESVKRKTKSFSCDYSDVVGRRLGFVPLPLAIVLIRVITPMFRVTNMLSMLMLCSVGYIGLASFRILNTIVLVGKAVKIIDEHYSNENHGAGGGGGAAAGAGQDGSVVVNSSASTHHHRSSILKRSRTISGSDGDLLMAIKNEGKGEKKLTFVDLKDEGETATGLQKIHLLANSNVSLTSVGFNEEMLKVEEGIKKDATAVALISRLGARKHSLGSNLDDESVLLGSTVAVVDATQLLDTVIIKQEIVKEDDEQEHDNENAFAINDQLNTTLVEADYNNTLVEENAEQQQQQQLESSIAASCEDVEGSNNVVKRKKFNWFK